VQSVFSIFFFFGRKIVIRRQTHSFLINEILCRKFPFFFSSLKKKRTRLKGTENCFFFFFFFWGGGGGGVGLAKFIV
jgi:hypothetical protein